MLLYLTNASMFTTVSIPRRRARHGKTSVSRTNDQPASASIVMMFPGAMIPSISTLDRICVKHRTCSVASGKSSRAFLSEG